MDPFLKKPKSLAITPLLKKQLWTTYVGDAIKETACPLCGINKVYQFTNSGFEACHIVAKKFNSEVPSIYYLIVGCSACNNNCADICVLDYLFCCQRINALRKIIQIIYGKFIEEHEHTLARENRLIWNVLDYLYGARRFPAGGGIVNTKPIYEIARSEQLVALSEEIAVVSQSLVRLSKEYALVAECEIKPMKL
jgi:hypothetical protein